MRGRFASVIIAAVCIGLVACAPSVGGEKVDPDLECAALISAVSYMMADETIEQDAELVTKSLSASMIYLSKYAIPNGLSEPEAFEVVEVQRDRFRELLSPEQIERKARSCISRSGIRRLSG